MHWLDDWVLYSVKGVSPQTFPAPDVHDIISHIFMGMEIDNKKWSKLLSSWNSISTPGFQKLWPSRCLQVNEQSNSKIKCGILINFSVEIVLNNN